MTPTQVNVPRTDTISYNGYMGRIDISQLRIPPNREELGTARFFADLDKDIVFIQPSNIQENYRPDFVMDGNEWEVKNPVGKGKSTIERNLRHAVEQSDHIIFDLRHFKGDENSSIAKLKKEFQLRRNIREMYIIKRNGELITLPEKS